MFRTTPTGRSSTTAQPSSVGSDKDSKSDSKRDSKFQTTTHSGVKRKEHPTPETPPREKLQAMTIREGVGVQPRAQGSHKIPLDDDDSQYHKGPGEELLKAVQAALSK